MKQKDKFLGSEGNAWLKRNCDAIENRKLQGEDAIISEIQKLPPPRAGNRFSVLEIGCSNRLSVGMVRKKHGLSV